MMRVRSKICGITNLEDALAAVDAGADALGLVFYPPSPRAVTIEQAQQILAGLPPFVCSVGLFVDASRQELDQHLAQLPLDLLQLHGDESSEYCENLPRPYIKALRVRPGEDLAAQAVRYKEARAILLDSFVAGVPGGTGQAFDWQLVPEDFPKPLVLAGGLNAANVAQAIAELKPYAVDVSGGVERTKGLKDHAQLRAFIRAVQSASI